MRVVHLNNIVFYVDMLLFFYIFLHSTQKSVLNKEKGKMFVIWPLCKGRRRRACWETKKKFNSITGRVKLKHSPSKQPHRWPLQPGYFDFPWPEIYINDMHSVQPCKLHTINYHLILHGCVASLKVVFGIFSIWSLNTLATFLERYKQKVN